MKTKSILLALCLALGASSAMAFCGFYVARADGKLSNKSSEVIMVRDGNKTVITMSNDYQGDLKEFAMVVPVPEVLKEENIRIADAKIFQTLNAYSGPRLVEYHDPNPCYQAKYKAQRKSAFAGAILQEEEKKMDLDTMNDDVVIEARYTVGEYDILILSAKESSGLKTWLTSNGYKVPASAEEVLEPYIKSDLKFFVVKVNLERQMQSGFNTLRPIQIAFTSDKFMLPIRLGMANATEDQDLIVYAFTKKGRVETTNYRTVKLPTNKNIPEFVSSNYQKFYGDVFATACKRQNSKAVFLEYAWDLSSSNFLKCDPCASTPPNYKDLREAGVYWINNKRYGGSNYQGELFVTRLHVRYNRSTFPQDLAFQITPNRQNFQGRYVMQRCVKQNLTCEGSQAYYKGVLKRRKAELKELANLTGWNPNDYQSYLSEIERKIKKQSNGWINGGSFGSFQPKPVVKPEAITTKPAQKDSISAGNNMVIATNVISEKPVLDSSAKAAMSSSSDGNSNLPAEKIKDQAEEENIQEATIGPIGHFALAIIGAFLMVLLIGRGSVKKKKVG